MHGAFLQHVLVMECHLGRFLTSHERVHHRDHDRQNNSLENLELFGSQAEHMKAHWQNKGIRRPGLIEKIRIAAANPNMTKMQLRAEVGISLTSLHKLIRENDILWVRGDYQGRVWKMNDAMVREALQGRNTVQAAAHLGCHVQTLYNRFGHLLTKRATKGCLDQFREEILRLVYKEQIPRAEVAAKYGVSDQCVTKSIQRWSKQDAKSGAPVLRQPPRCRPGPKPGYMAQRRAQQRKELDAAR